METKILMQMLGNKLRVIWKESPNALIAWVLMASYAYYHKDSPILEDSTYDKMCKHLYDKWNSYEHRHKHLINRDSLKQGSLFSIKEGEYPLLLRSAATDLIEEVYGDWRGATII